MCWAGDDGGWVGRCVTWWVGGVGPGDTRGGGGDLVGLCWEWHGGFGSVLGVALSRNVWRGRIKGATG